MFATIRPEQHDDASTIQTLTKNAFAFAAHKSGTEQLIIEALRDAGALTISLVAEVEGHIVGHVAISPVQISDGSTGWFGLGPISVQPDHQGRGIGSQLMKKALSDLQAQGAAGCVLLGNPDFYSRFGFRNVPDLVLPEVPAEYFQALAFGTSFPSGIVAYHEAFAATG